MSLFVIQTEEESQLQEAQQELETWKVRVLQYCCVKYCTSRQGARVTDTLLNMRGI